MSAELNKRLLTLRDFLAGRKEMDGKWFGDSVAPTFWWREHLIDIEMSVARIAVLELEVARLQALNADLSLHLSLARGGSGGEIL